MGCTKSSVKREFIAIQAYFKKQEKTNKQPNLTHKPTTKRRRRKTTTTTKKKQNQKKRKYKDQSRNKWK